MRIDEDRAGKLVASLHTRDRVAGLTHAFYNYPARFSPLFARAAIECFTKRGDLVFDPFMGGGTTLVEAMALGRRAAGTDISSLATFISRTKTTIYTKSELELVARWAAELPSKINIHLERPGPDDWADRGYLRNLNQRENWRITKAIELALASLESIEVERAIALARIVVLRAAQWALDAKKTPATIEQFRQKLTQCATEGIKGAEDFAKQVRAMKLPAKQRRALCLHGAAKDLVPDLLEIRLRPKLILTSPPYPGVHVLYHRWQVDGRKETPAPFWITRQLDGSGITHYAMGDRKQPQLASYYANLKASFEAVRKICGERTIVAQLIAFSDPSWQLPRYLETMSDCGFAEVSLCAADMSGRVWRDVPNRKWYNEGRPRGAAGTELLLIHRPA
ncbi:MAG: TRM11 family SAM-dependent methyltransferase [Parvularculaceae bacterium]